MTRPLDRITARCERDGEFQVDRKPKTGSSALTTCGQDNSQWLNVVCPKCRMWAEVVRVERVC